MSVPSLASVPMCGTPLPTRFSNPRAARLQLAPLAHMPPSFVETRHREPSSLRKRSCFPCCNSTHPGASPADGALNRRAGCGQRTQHSVTAQAAFSFSRTKPGAKQLFRSKTCSETAFLKQSLQRNSRSVTKPAAKQHCWSKTCSETAFPEENLQ